MWKVGPVWRSPPSDPANILIKQRCWNVGTVTKTEGHFHETFQRVTLGHFEPSAKEYRRIAIHEQLELLSFMGEIARDNKGQSQLHVKVVVGKSDGTACGGHLFEASVRPTMEIVVVESPWELRRRVREDIGLALLDLKRW